MTGPEAVPPRMLWAKGCDIAFISPPSMLDLIVVADGAIRNVVTNFNLPRRACSASAAILC